MPRSPNKPRPGGIRPLDHKLLHGWPLPQPGGEQDKDARGRVLIIGGAHQMPGPIILAATAALRAGAGKLQIATVNSTGPHVATAVPEAFVHELPESRDGGFGAGAARLLVAAASRAHAVLIGPGMVENAVLAALVMRLLRSLQANQIVVLDAGALTIFAGTHTRLRELACKLIVTPHAGEMATLLGRRRARIVRQTEGTVVEAALALGATAVLKGAETLVSDGKEIYRNRAGNPGLGTSGSGDVLSGIIAGLAARGAAPLQAAVWGVHLHARAGDALAKRLGPLGYLARELATEIPALLQRYQRR